MTAARESKKWPGYVRAWREVASTAAMSIIITRYIITRTGEFIENMKLSSTYPARSSWMIVRLTLIIIFRDISNFKCHDKKTIEIGQSNARKSLHTDIDASWKHREFQECCLECQYKAEVLDNCYDRIISKIRWPEFHSVLWKFHIIFSRFWDAYLLKFTFSSDGASLR